MKKRELKKSVGKDEKNDNWKERAGKDDEKRELLSIKKCWAKKKKEDEH